MALLPKNDSLSHITNNVETKQSPRSYLGLSQIGSSCHRNLQYYHYWASSSYISARIQRLFNVGHDAEPIMIASLAEAGITIDQQQREFIGTGGHWKGHWDGRGHWDEYPGCYFAVEFKTHNDKSFKDLVKKKVKVSKPTHYAQMQSYMGYSDLPKCLYMAMNKNDSTYYFEWVEFDEEFFNELKRKEAEIIMADTLLPRIGNDSIAWFECKMCNSKEVCFKKKDPERSCRTCMNVDVLPEGEWACMVDGGCYTLDVDEQRTSCDKYILSGIFEDD